MRASTGGAWIVVGDMARQFKGGVGSTSSIVAGALALYVNRKGDVYMSMLKQLRQVVKSLLRRTGALDVG